MKHLVGKAALWIPVVGIVAGLALLAFVLAGPSGNRAGADPAVSVGVDTNPYATTTNTATYLGSIERCVAKPGPAAESGTTQCGNTIDDDGDTVVNDGCPTSGAYKDCDANHDGDCTDPGPPAESTLCDNAIDDDSDGKVNDGCPATGVPFDIDAYIKDVPPMRGFAATFNYTAGVLRVMNKNVMMFLASGSGSTVLDLSDLTLPDTDGYYGTGAFDTTGPHESGSGVLVRLTLQAVGTGVSPAELTMVNLWDTEGNPIPPVGPYGYFVGPILNGQIAVGMDCPDTDHDTIPDTLDNCPLIANADQADADGDGIGNVCDACPNTAPGASVDTNGCSQIRRTGIAMVWATSATTARASATLTKPPTTAIPTATPATPTTTTTATSTAPRATTAPTR
jgi:hypothetical protein